MKKYNLFCLKCNSIQSNCIEITEQLNDEPFSRRDIFDNFFGRILPDFDDFFSRQPYKFYVSIDKVFFSPFNKEFNYFNFAFRLDYLKNKFSFLADKIVVSRLSVKNVCEEFLYVFFVKEVI